ncbi:MAG: glycogen debranching enzyme N-terminal domain-containing protein, partial [Cytophagales bacterium]|nr:glycogen debranching enzyme N-terminal domain-containing protein [Cytophagales bacterium]
MKLELGRSIINVYEEACSREWLETNGLGGYASGTISGVNTRRYHGLLVASLKPPLERKVLLSKLDETIIRENGEKVELSCNQFPGKVSPAGFLHMEKYFQDPFPVFVYDLGDIKIVKTIVAVHGENTTLVTYEVTEASAPFTLSLKPLVAYRDYHYCIRANDRVKWGSSFGHNTLLLNPYPELPQMKIHV